MITTPQNLQSKKSEYVYFIYSEQQKKERTEAEARNNKLFVPGEVLVMGEWKEFTQVSNRPSLPLFADSRVVAEGYKDRITFRDCANQWKI